MKITLKCIRIEMIQIYKNKIKSPHWKTSCRNIYSTSLLIGPVNSFSNFQFLFLSIISLRCKYYYSEVEIYYSHDPRTFVLMRDQYD